MERFSGNKLMGVFKSIHHVLKLEKELEKAGKWCDIVPLPKEISVDCTMGLLFEKDDFEFVKNTVKSWQSGETRFFVCEGKNYFPVN